ncbi:hypothetical protein KYC_08715 [Achromobacter arsenitoxydans SY8]|uniref:Uncharacterized protein n=1 Tax=Achromobacter arsenitoxydans SY8 TaxID=477184 RepID=H0F4Q1_9BURK|nr:hypothetical protein KYC_08715 [Achromobacter arsenitoxydans SY8]
MLDEGVVRQICGVVGIAQPPVEPVAQPAVMADIKGANLLLEAQLRHVYAPLVTTA